MGETKGTKGNASSKKGRSSPYRKPKPPPIDTSQPIDTRRKPPRDVELSSSHVIVGAGAAPSAPAGAISTPLYNQPIKESGEGGRPLPAAADQRLSASSRHFSDPSVYPHNIHIELGGGLSSNLETLSPPLSAASPVLRRHLEPTIHTCSRFLIRIMGSATHAATTFLDSFLTAVIFPGLPAAAATLTGRAKDVPLLAALIAGALFAGRLFGALWWYYRHTSAHPSAKGDITSLSGVMLCALTYSLIYFIMGFINRTWILVAGQFIIGLVMGGHAVTIRISQGGLLAGAMIGPLIGGLFDAQHATSSSACANDPNCTVWAAGLPMAPVALAVLTLGICTALVSMVIAYLEPAHTQDSSYRPLAGSGSIITNNYNSNETTISTSVNDQAGSHHQQAAAAALLNRRNSHDNDDHYSINEGENPGPVILVPPPQSGQKGERSMSTSSLNSPYFSTIPARYIRGCAGDVDEAGRRWRETLIWRRENGIDDILFEPQTNFKIMKECYPHFLHRRDKYGHPIYYELLGRINLKKLKAQGVSVQDVVRYYIFLTEYIWNKIETDDDYGAMVSILDVENVGIMDLRGDALEFLKSASRVVQQHYVERSFKMFILNAPSWFSVLWKIVAPLLHENTRKKINILGRDHKPLLEVIDPENLPTKYGGYDTANLGESPEEEALREYVEGVNSGRIKAPAAAVVESLAGGEGGGTASIHHPRAGSIASMASAGGGGWVTPASRASLDETEGEGVEGENSSDEDKDERENGEESRLTRLVGLGKRLLVPFAGLASIIPGSLFSSSSEGPAVEANLGSDNKFVYDEARGVWVLRDDIEEGKRGGQGGEGEGGGGDGQADESEERLIRAIQAAHGYVDGEREPVSLRGSRHSFPRKVDSDRLNHYHHRENQAAVEAGIMPLTGRVSGGVGAGLLHHYRLQESWSERRSRTGPFLLYSMLTWRALSLSILLVLPLYLADYRHFTSFEIALVLFLGAFLTMGLWGCDRIIAVLSTYSTILHTFLLLTIALALLGPLTSSSSSTHHHGGFAKGAADGLAVAVTCLALVLLGGSVTWSIHLSRALYRKDLHIARFDLTPSLGFADVLGAVVGSLMYYASTTYGAPPTPTTTSYTYPLGPPAWFNLLALCSGLSFLFFGYYGHVPLQPLPTTPLSRISSGSYQMGG